MQLRVNCGEAGSQVPQPTCSWRTWPGSMQQPGREMQEPVQSLLFDLLKSMDNFYKADTSYSSLMPALPSLSSFSSFSSLSSIWVWQWRRALASHFIFRVAKVAPSRHRWHCSRLHKLPTVPHLHSCTVPHPAFAPQLQLHHNCPVPQ